MRRWRLEAYGLWPSDNRHGPILQEGIDQCAIYLQTAVVVDEPFFLNAYINLLTLARVVPTISARVAWLTFRGFSGFDSLVICPNNNSARASRFSLKLKN